MQQRDTTQGERYDAACGFGQASVLFRRSAGANTRSPTTMATVNIVSYHLCILRFL